MSGTAETVCPTPGCGNVFPPMAVKYAELAFTSCPKCGALVRLTPAQGECDD